MVLVGWITDNSPNLPNFSPTKLSRYTVCQYTSNATVLCKKTSELVAPKEIKEIGDRFVLVTVKSMEPLPPHHFQRGGDFSLL